MILRVLRVAGWVLLFVVSFGPYIALLASEFVGGWGLWNIPR